MKSRRAVIRSFALGLALFAGLTAESNAAAPPAPKVIAVVVGNTRDGDIGEGVRNNIGRLDSLLRLIDKVGKIETRVRKIVEADFTCAKIDAVLNDLGRVGYVGRDDVIVFYYAGHGFRDDVTLTDFPKLLCGGLQDGLDFELVARRLRATRARMVIAVADACNKRVSVETRPVTAGPGLDRIDKRQARIRKLFLDYRGALRMAAAKRDEVAFYGPTERSTAQVGYFSDQLLSTLFRSIHDGSPEARWDKIVPRAVREIEIRVAPNAPVSAIQRPFAVDELQLLQPSEVPPTAAVQP